MSVHQIDTQADNHKRLILNRDGERRPYVQMQSDDGPHAPYYASPSSVTMSVINPSILPLPILLCSIPSTRPSVERHNGESIRNAKLPLQMWPIMPQRRRLRKFIHLGHIHLRPILHLCLFVNPNHPHNHLSNLRLLKAIAPHCASLHLLQYPPSLFTRRKPLQFDSHTICRRRRRTRGDGSEERDETCDGLGEEGPTGILGESGEQRGGGW